MTYYPINLKPKYDINEGEKFNEKINWCADWAPCPGDLFTEVSVSLGHLMVICLGLGVVLSDFWEKLFFPHLKVENTSLRMDHEWTGSGLELDKKQNPQNLGK